MFIVVFHCVSDIKKSLILQQHVPIYIGLTNEH